MFGYVRAYKPEMKMKHYEEYRGVYCSVCRALGKRYGLIARLTLSYDYTFLAMLRLSVHEERPCFENGRCPFNPTKRCNFCKNKDDELFFVADVAMIMVYYKILDDIYDGGFFKKLICYLILPFFAFYHKKAKKLCPEAERIVSEMTQKQRETEDKKSALIDEAADPTAAALGEILSLGFEGKTGRILKRIGYLTGRWVYIADALDDIEKDKKSGSYNAFLLNGQENDAAGILNLTAGELLNAYELLEPKSFDSQIRNIITDGLYHTALNIGGKKDERSL